MRLAPLLAAALALAATGCRTPRAAAPDPDAGQRMCTMDFRSVGFTLVDAAGRPVPGARVDVRRTDGSLVETDESTTPPGGVGGRYTVADDGTRVVPSGETLTVNAARDGRAIAATYRIGHDGCHVTKISGADTLRLR